MQGLGILNKWLGPVIHVILTVFKETRFVYILCMQIGLDQKILDSVVFLRNNPHTSKYWLTTGPKKRGNNMFHFNHLNKTIKCRYVYTFLKVPTLKQLITHSILSIVQEIHFHETFKYA